MMESSSSSSGINTAIVRALKKYDGKIHLELLARELGRSPFEIRDILSRLEKENVVKLDGSYVLLTKP